MFYLSNPYSSFPYCILSLVLRLVVVVVVVVYDNEDDGVVIAIYRQFSIMLCADGEV